MLNLSLNNNNRIRRFIIVKKILEQLYNGNLYPFEKFQPAIEQFKIENDNAFQAYSAFLEKLPEELKEEFQNLMDSHINLLSLELEQNFIEGFCIGARMMTEVYTTPINEKHA